MSRSVSVNYALEAKRKREIYLNHLRNRISSNISLCEQNLSQISTAGIAELVKDEFDSTLHAIAQVRVYYSSDPEKVIDESNRLVTSTMTLLSKARIIKAELNQKQREYTGFLYDLFKKFPDPVVRDFAYDECKKLIATWKDVKLNLENNDTIKSKVIAEYDYIIAKAKIQADTWLMNKQREAEREAISALADNAISEMEKSAAGESKDHISKKLQSIIENAKTNSDADNQVLLNELDEVRQQNDKDVLDETYRKETIKAVMQSLQGLGFIFHKPRLIHDNNQDIVLVRAQRPAGNECEFKIGKDGSMKYSFENYEGMACKNDINAMLPKLEQVYGIKLSNERILWENPDKITKDAKPSPNGQHNKGGAND